RAVDLAVGVDPRVTPVARDLVVQIGLLTPPVPQRDHDVALDTLRALGPGERKLALLDAVGPVGEIGDAALRAEAVDRRDHAVHRLTGSDAPGPGGVRALERAELLRDRARRLVAEPVTSPTAVGLDAVEPLMLRPHLGRDAVAAVAGAGKLALLRKLHQRV